ncbi:MAG TPA: PSD1 and planctomycete cytochrome C domain-containing protein [Tepidisphaeraceae bacterium]|nr:PSD1 and planctomycete cytochrome C domain-containing protein [Tepidisphaeraceae bacterium]
MSRRSRYIVVGVLSLLMGAAAARAEGANPGGVEFFENRIRPLLVEHCYQCHSDAKKKKGGLLLDTRAALLKGGDSGPALVAGDPVKSRILDAVRYTNDQLRMPPDGKLSDAQIADLEAWVNMGAPDPREAKAPAVPGAASAMDLEEGRTWWAYQPPKDHPLPAVKGAAWAKQPIDRFILAKLEEKGLAPAREADRRTLIRRAYFDLLGLPPPTDQVEAFVADPSPDAYRKLIDDLLDSPLYGQRWARHWLDVVRYTDSFDARVLGGEQDVAFAWRYRDWVVDAYNHDLPYDQFIMQQIAGDLLPAPQGQTLNKAGVVATGVYAIGEWGGGDSDKDKLITDIVDDQVDLTTRAFLGLTVSCARCHDHKFDPISIQDYYGLAGIFFSTHILPNPGPKTAGPVTIRVPLLDEVELARRKADEARVAQLAGEIETALDAHYAALAAEMLPRTGAYLAAAWEYEHRPASSAKQPIETFAADRGLHPCALRQWVGQLSTPPLKLMSRSIPNINAKAGVHAWRNAEGADAPIVLINTNTTPVETIPTLSLPGKSVSVHPSPSAGVAVAWRSPITGTVRVSGSVSDGHSVCGDGIAWSLARLGTKDPDELASGTIANGGRQSLHQGTGGAELGSVEVTAGDMIQLVVLPKVEYSCDTTQVELEITEAGGGRTWDLTADALASAHLVNPMPDAHGNAGVWHFHDLAGQATSLFTAGSPLGRFAAAVASGDNLEKVRAAATDAATSLRDVDRSALTDPRGVFWSAARADDANLPDQTRDQLIASRAEMKKLAAALAEPIPVAQAMQEGGTPQSMFDGIQDIPVHIRGRYDKLGEVVPRRFPIVLAGENQTPIKTGSGRLQLAQWIASSDHPLTARVMVNRIWQHHFGEGLVRTPNNFGKLGTPPTHPQLLDYLARQFVRSGWSVKEMHRSMMLSATYMQSSAPSPEALKLDPDNQLLARMNRRKLEAEALRDALLAAAGTLDVTPNGPAVNDLNTPRRSLYLMTIRSDRSNFRALFDAADASAIVERRIDSTVAPQALFLMNHPFVLERSRQLAERAAKAGPDDAPRIDWLYRTLFARQPTADELQIGIKFLGSSEADWNGYCHLLLCANEFVYVD